MKAFGKEPKTGKWIEATPEDFDRDPGYPRGSVLNFQADGEFLADSGTYIDKVDRFLFTTGVTVVDIRGGERLGGKDLQAPSQVMLMDPSGNFVIRREFDDAAEVTAARDLYSKKRDGAKDFQPEGGRRGGAVDVMQGAR